MIDERRRILDMLAQGKVTVDEAEKLLAAVGEPADGREPLANPMRTADRARARYLRVMVEPLNDEGDHVDIRVPLQLLRAGVKLAAIIPKDAQGKVATALDEKGISLDLANLRPEAIEELIEGMGELSVNVDTVKEKVRIFCE